MGDRPFHREDKADSGLPIQAIREKLASRFGPLPGDASAAPPKRRKTDSRQTLRPRSLGGEVSAEPVPAGTTLLSRLNSLLDASRRLRQSASLVTERPDVAQAAQACVAEVQERIASLREAIDISAANPDINEKAMRDMLDAHTQLADAQDVLIRAQRELISTGHALIDRRAARPQQAPDEAAPEEPMPFDRAG